MSQTKLPDSSNPLSDIVGAVQKATIGQGAIVTSDTSTGQDSLAGVNRDPFNTENIIKDQQTAGLGVDANIDARVFTKAGRAEIAEERKGLLDKIESIENNVEGSVTLGYGITKDVYKSILILKKIEEVRATLTPEEQVIFDNELKKLQAKDPLKSNIAPVIIGAEAIAAGAAGAGGATCVTVNCSEAVVNGAKSAYNV
ncbi:hypothetical protein [Psychrobacter phenylpyruvicus]|nr:hypothetical protein [Psychrobacter phenylpyruvicus]